MKARKKQKAVKKSRLIPVLAILLAVGIIGATASFSVVASQESRDAFCASCHTQPETTYFDRSTAAGAVDLASFHTARQTRCIDCHSGQGLGGRLSAELLGAHNALAWVSGSAVQPAVLSRPIADANCLKCHQGVTGRSYVIQETTLPGSQMNGEGRAGHWHQVLSEWQAVDAKAASCVSCHGGHATGSTAANGFMNIPAVQDTCQACHAVASGG